MEQVSDKVDDGAAEPGRVARPLATGHWACLHCFMFYSATSAQLRLHTVLQLFNYIFFQCSKSWLVFWYCSKYEV